MNKCTLSGQTAQRLEPGESCEQGTWLTVAGAGDVDGVTMTVAWSTPAQASLKPHSMWQHLLDHGTPDQLTPLEHRWAWGQYYMPPSTDGAWFEQYRNMLIREADNDTLMLLQATPRTWLDHGKTIVVESAPTT